MAAFAKQGRPWLASTGLLVLAVLTQAVAQSAISGSGSGSGYYDYDYYDLETDDYDSASPDVPVATSPPPFSICDSYPRGECACAKK